MEKSITVRFTNEEYTQLFALAKKNKMSLQNFIKSMAILFTDNNDLLAKINNPEIKKSLENDLKIMAGQLEKKQKFVDLLLRSIYSTQLSLEGQFIKSRKEAAKELKKDVDRIKYMVSSSSQ